MEHGPHSAERDADPAPSALADLRPDGPQQPLDLAPSKIGGRRLCEDPGQGSSVPTVHLDMISEMDIGDRRINNGPTTVYDFSAHRGPQGLAREVATRRQPRLSRSAFASFRSAVSKPSVNQP
jgi:hypothetical protein